MTTEQKVAKAIDDGEDPVEIQKRAHQFKTSYAAVKSRLLGKRCVAPRVNGAIWEWAAVLSICNEVEPSWVVERAFSDACNVNKVFPNVFAGYALWRSVKETCDAGGAAMEDEYNADKYIFHEYAVCWTGSRKLDTRAFKKAMLSTRGDGCPPYVRFMLVYPYVPTNPSQFDKAVIKEGLSILNSNPEFSVLIKKLGIDKQAMKLWATEYGV